LTSKSKIPPQFTRARGQIGHRIGEDVELLGFHGEIL